MSKLTILKQFINEHAHLPEQGTDEWKTQRLNRIGGSEISTVLKQNKNKSVNKLIMEKLDFDKFTGNAITYWGNVFEELIRVYSEQEFNCSILETGSIPYNQGYLSYSPDGLSVVSKEKLSKYINLNDMGLDNNDKEFLTLFEFKCPHSRLPDYNIPEHYLPQITIGMNIINIMETGLFIQAVYRRCLFKDMAYNNLHNGYGHYKRVSMNNNPIETGFMIMYCDDTDYKNDLVDYLESDSRNQLINNIVDISSIYESSSFEEIMKECVSKKIKIDYSYREKYCERVFSADGMTQAFYNIALQYRANKALLSAIDKYQDKIIGIMPYKLLDVYISPVAKNHTYIDDQQALTKAKKIVDCINHHRNIGSKNKAEVAKSVRSFKL